MPKYLQSHETYLVNKLNPIDIELNVTISGVTYTLKDDGDGNIYDLDHSTSLLIQIKFV